MSDENKREYTVVVEQDQPFKDHTAEGWYVKETWMKDGKIGRVFGPAISILHPVTHVVVKEEYLDKEGHRHRISGPAVTYRNPHNGQIERERYFKHGTEYWQSQQENYPEPL